MKRFIFFGCSLILLAISPGAAQISGVAPNAGKSGQTITLVAPSFGDEPGLRNYIDNASLEQRLALYGSYLASRSLNPGASSLLAGYFAEDLGLASPEKRKSLADLALRTAKSKDLSDASASRLELFLQGLPLHHDLAVNYYLSLPLDGRSGNFDAVSLEGNRAQVLADLLPEVLPKLGPSTRQALFAESLHWLEKGTSYDGVVLRGISAILAERPISIFTATEASASLSRPPSFSGLPKPPLTERELSYFLPLFFRFAESDVLARPVTTFQSPWMDIKKDAETEKALASACTSKDPRIASLGNYIQFLEKGTGSGKSQAWLPMKAIPGLADDWVAFISYRVAAARGEVLSDEGFLACLDPARPSLAAAVLEDRFGPEYHDMAETIIVNYKKPSLSPFREAVLRKCQTLTGADSERALIPVYMTLMHLGRADYLTSITVLVKAPFATMREFALLTLLRYGDQTNFGLFMDRLHDPGSRIRTLAIQGLGKIRDSRAVDALAKIATDPAESQAIRIAAVDALGQIGDRRMVRILTNILVVPANQASLDSGLRIHAAHLLGEQRERTAVDALLRNIDTARENDLNYYCLEALGKIEDPEGFRKLVPLLMKGWKAWIRSENYRDNFY
ncbi:MAG: HEAT repeat domain-containing protein, partial [Spirochaetota bacterium]